MRTAIPVDGRFEHIVLSCNATSDHAIIWIEREAEKAFEVLLPDCLPTCWFESILSEIEHVLASKLLN